MKNLLLCLGAIAIFVGCATSGKVIPRQPLQTKLNGFTNYYVEVKSSNTEFQRLAEPLKLTVTKSIEKLLHKKVSQRGPASSEGAAIELTIKSYDKGSGFARFINMGGEAKILASGRVFDMSTKTLIHKFDLEGTSLHEGGRTTVNGIPVSGYSVGSDDLTQRALDSAGLYLAKYLVGEQDK
ncbi:MAG: hypothetical protein JNM39_15755 [Bdellovibrionaceae bacterium]|nr:hypothetical protein [Pseudobdellovibrionaceae bacterium]